MSIACLPPRGSQFRPQVPSDGLGYESHGLFRGSAAQVGRDHEDVGPGVLSFELGHPHEAGDPIGLAAGDGERDVSAALAPPMTAGEQFLTAGELLADGAGDEAGLETPLVEGAGMDHDRVGLRHHVRDGLAEAVCPAGVALRVGLSDVEHEVDPVVRAGRVDLVGLQRSTQSLRVAIGDVETDQIRVGQSCTRGSFPSPCRLGRTPRRAGPRAPASSSCHPWRLNTTGLPFLRRASQLFCAVSLTRTVKGSSRGRPRSL